jgi:hypothetical protein
MVGRRLIGWFRLVVRGLWLPVGGLGLISGLRLWFVGLDLSLLERLDLGEVVGRLWHLISWLRRLISWRGLVGGGRLLIGRFWLTVIGLLESIL